MAKKAWIKGAVDPEHKGDFSAKAKASGMSTADFARKHQHSPGKLGKQARLAMTLSGMSHGGAKPKNTERERISMRYRG